MPEENTTKLVVAFVDVQRRLGEMLCARDPAQILEARQLLGDTGRRRRERAIDRHDLDLAEQV